jgi:predicted porin
MNQLKKTLLAAAALSAMTASPLAMAQSSVSIYGLIDMSAGQYELAHVAGTDAKRWVVDSGNMSTSFIGFKGSEDLGGGLRGVFALESFFRADVGGSGRFGADGFWTRAAYVGLSSNSLGTLTLGRNTNPFFVSTLVFNAFGDSFGYSPVIRQYFGDRGVLIGDSGFTNAIAYSNPTFSGFTVNLAGSLGEGTTGPGKNFSGNIMYFGGPLSLTLAAQDTQNNVYGKSTVNGIGIGSAGFDGQRSYQVGAAYDFGFVKLFGQYGMVETKVAGVNPEWTIASVGAAVPLGGGKILAQYSQSKSDSATASIIGGPVGATSRIATVGYDYNLSKRTDAYAVYMNDRLTDRSSGNSFMVGVRHRF